MSSLKSLAITGLLALCSLAAEASAQTSRLGITVKDCASPEGALVTHVRQGYPATQMRRMGSSESYYLAAKSHVILELNGTRVYHAAACIREASLMVYNRHRRTTNEYFIVLNGDAEAGFRGYGSASVNDSGWTPGAQHPSAPHVVAGQRKNDWISAPGYRSSQRSGGIGVRWSPWAKHPNHPHVIAGLIEGRCVPEPGYQWKDRSRWQIVADTVDGSFGGSGSSTPGSSSNSSSYEEPNWGWKASQWQIQDEINRSCLPR